MQLLSAQPVEIAPPSQSYTKHTNGLNTLLLPEDQLRNEDRRTGKSKAVEAGVSGVREDRHLPIPQSKSTLGSCTRHGRKLRMKALGAPTVEGLDRSLSGAYIPSGLKIRHQVDPLSPWYFHSRNLTKTEGTSLSPEPCPDCLAEDRIRKTELAEELEETGLYSIADRPSTSSEASSTMTEPGTPAFEDFTGSTMIGTLADHQNVVLPGTAIPELRDAEQASLVAADLGDMIDAIIIEHRSMLNRVITNLRDGLPTQTQVQRISRELSAVSDSIGTVSPNDVEPRTSRNGRYSIILDTPPKFLESRTKSIPELLDYIDSAANDLGLRLSAESSPEDELTKTIPDEDSHHFISHDRTGVHGKVSDESTEEQIVPGSPSFLPADGSKSESDFQSLSQSITDKIVAVHGKRGTGVESPRASTSTMDRTPLEVASSTFEASASPAKPIYSAPPRVTATKPERRGSIGAKRMSQSMRRLPEIFRKRDETPEGTALYEPKLDEVQNRHKQQVTFPQAFLKDKAKDASSKERSQRRARVGREPVSR
ncbi:hypothetical protein ANO11243_006050 [Dothideomycetidae sp. 11243]|nr:hypothetical protein ANO11243_006050 [fungal sp. No.11243]